MTNAALAAGKSGARAVATFADGADGQRGAVVADLCERLKAPSADVGKFLSTALVVDAELPPRQFMETQQRIDLLGPVYGHLGESAEGSTDEYWALLGPIARRNAAPSTLAEDHRLALATGAGEQEARLRDATIAARTITTEDAIKYLIEARVDPYRTLPPLKSDAPPETRMTKKLTGDMRGTGLSGTEGFAGVRWGRTGQHDSVRKPCIGVENGQQRGCRRRDSNPDTRIMMAARFRSAERFAAIRGHESGHSCQVRVACGGGCCAASDPFRWTHDSVTSVRRGCRVSR
jgi:hypothetical protein